MAGPNILVATQARALRRALTAYLYSTPGDPQVETSGELAAALDLLETRQSDVFVLDADLVDARAPVSLAGILLRLRRQYPHLNLIVLVDSAAQETLSLTAGATYALHKGQLDGRLAEAVLASRA